MLLILPIILSIIFTHSLFIPMLAITYYSTFVVKLHMAAAKIVYFSVTKIDIINSS